MTRTLLSAALVAAILSVSAPAWADDTTVAEAHMSVPATGHADAAATAKLYRQLQMQARYVCDTAASYDHDYDTAREKACEAQAMSDALRQINRDDLSRLDDQAHGHAVRDLSLNTSGR